MLVAACSPVLQSMLLTSGLAETKLGRVRLADIRGPVMHACIEYLYTDGVQDSSWPDPLDEAMEVAAAARFFLIPGLERHCVDRLAAAIAHIEVPSLSLAGEIIRAYNLGTNLYHDQPDEKLDFLLKAFAEILYYALKQGFNAYKLLSESGCLRLLGDVKLSDAFSLREYYRLLHAIRWCASRVLVSNSSLEEDEMLDILDKFFPFSQERLHAILEKGSHIPVDVHKLQMIRMLSNPLASFLDKAPLNLSKVPVSILCTVFEPLQIIPCSKLLAAYRIHALYRPNLRWNDLYLHRNYAISEVDPTEISCDTTSNGFEDFVTSNMCVLASRYLIFEWEIVMLEQCQKLRYGFFYGEKIVRFPKGSAGYLIESSQARGRLLVEQNRSLALGSDGCLYQDNKGVHIEGAHFCVTKGTRLGVHIDFRKGRCSFKVDGVVKAMGLISKGNGGVYPAMVMQSPGKCRLQMVLQESALKEDILTMPYLDQGHRDSE